MAWCSNALMWCIWISALQLSYQNDVNNCNELIMKGFQDMGEKLQHITSIVNNNKQELQIMKDQVTMLQADMEQLKSTQNLQTTEQEKLMLLQEQTLSNIKDLNRLIVDEKMPESMATAEDLNNTVNSLEKSIDVSLDINSPNGKEKCPDDEGFFQVPGSSQCLIAYWGVDYGYFTREEANQKCLDEGFVLAKPEIPLEVQKYLNVKYGGFWYWVGAIGDGSQFKWKADGTVVNPKLIGTTSYGSGPCLGLNARGVPGLYDTVELPGVPYYPSDCSDSYGKAPLCEVKRN